jgi:hypothetical protein
MRKCGKCGNVEIWTNSAFIAFPHFRIHVEEVATAGWPTQCGKCGKCGNVEIWMNSAFIAFPHPAFLVRRLRNGRLGRRVNAEMQEMRKCRDLDELGIHRIPAFPHFC